MSSMIYTLSKHAAILSLVLVVCECKAQSNAGPSELLIESAFHNFHQEPVAKRKFLALKQKTFVQKLNPVMYISGTLLFIYQRVISEQLQSQCSYENSCSNNMKARIEKEGFKGFFMGIDQLTSCFSAVIGDYPKHKISDNHKVHNDF